MAEERTKILAAVSDWLKLLTLIVLVAEFLMLAAMKMTPENNPIHSWYPIFMLAFLAVIVVGVFFERYLKAKRYIASGIHFDVKNGNPTIKADDVLEIQGVWADKFKHKGELRVALLKISSMENKLRIHGYEYNQSLEEAYEWWSHIAKFNETDRILEYLYTTISYEDDPTKTTYGFTRLNFQGSPPKRYSGFFFNVFDPNQKPRYETLKGAKISEPELYESDEGRKILVKQLMQES